MARHSIPMADEQPQLKLEERQRPLKPRVRVPDTPELRAWAQLRGFDVGDRGRLPDAVEVAYCQEKLIDLTR
jgi:hypothetical protein